MIPQIYHLILVPKTENSNTLQPVLLTTKKRSSLIKTKNISNFEKKRNMIAEEKDAIKRKKYILIVILDLRIKIKNLINRFLKSFKNNLIVIKIFLRISEQLLSRWK